MPSKYGRKNRDRKGGHEPSMIQCPTLACKIMPTTAIRASMKHTSKKLARRQAKKAVEQALAWEALADEQFSAIDIAESYGDEFWNDWNDILDDGDDWDYHEYLREQDEEARRQNAWADDSWYDPHYDGYDDHNDHSPYGSSRSSHEADRLTSRARQYSHLAAGTLVTEADLGKTVCQVLEEAYIRAHEEDDRFTLSAW